MARDIEVRLAYGRDGLAVRVPEDSVVVTPAVVPALVDEAGAVVDALRSPVSGPPLRSVVRPGCSVAVVFPDLTRPMPNTTVLPPLLAELAALGCGPDNVELLCSTGTHRQATHAEMEALVGPSIMREYRIHDHVATDESEHVRVGAVDGTDVLLDRRYVEADVRIVTGFVEPHFFAGFSGGPKAVAPGLAALSTTLEAHSPTRIADAAATWLRIDDNPVAQFIRAAVALDPPEFSVDVTIDRQRRLTAVFAGALPSSHEAACRYVEETAVRRVEGRFDVVVSTNGGFPLDRNLYQATKGMAAAERVVADGGTVVMAAELLDGYPDEGRFADMVLGAAGWRDLVAADVAPELDRWAVQVMGRVLGRARVGLYSDGLSAEQVRAAHLDPVADVSAAVRDALASVGGGGRVCVLPEGPLTVATPT